jgi:hypothetical protein
MARGRGAARGPVVAADLLEIVGLGVPNAEISIAFTRRGVSICWVGIAAENASREYK